VSATASRPKPGSRFASTARRSGSRRGGAVSTTRRLHSRRRDGSPASVPFSGVSSGRPDESVPELTSQSPKACTVWERTHARDAAWNARALSSTGGEATATARVDAAGRLPRAPSPETEYPRREGRFTARHHMPPRRLVQRRDAAERAFPHNGLVARRAFGVELDGAARGGPQPFLQPCPDPNLARSLGRRGLG
jgi:hypothetical protein